MGQPDLCKYDPRFFTSESIEDTSEYGDRDRARISFQDHLSASMGTFDLDNLLSSGDTDQSIQALAFDLDWDHHSVNSDMGDVLVPPTQSFPADLSHGDTVSLSETQQRQRTTITRNKEFNGHFKGFSSWMNIAASFPGLHKFLQNTIHEHHVLGASKWSSSAVTMERRPSVPRGVGDVDLRRLLPDEPRCIHFSKLYFENLGGTHGLIHESSFWQENQRFRDGKHENVAWFCALTLALISCSRCLFQVDSSSSSHNGLSAQNEVSEWVHGIEAWLDNQQDRKSAVEGFQLRCLLLFSKIINDIDGNNHYKASQVLLTEAISRGLHRDCRALGATESALERQIRRKTWSAIAGLDIACCVEQGVPSMASDLYSDIGPPENWNNDDYNEAMQSEVTTRSDNDFTDSSFARRSHLILPLRYNTIKLVNNPFQHQSYCSHQRSALRQQISSALADIPPWPDTAQGPVEQKRALISRISLELSLHELLLLLHIPFTVAKSAVDMDFERFVCARSASMIIKTHELATERGLSYIALPKSHLLRAGLCICLLEMEGRKSSMEFPAIFDPVRLVESAINMAEQRALVLETDVQSIWLLSAASCFLKSRRDPAASVLIKKQITDHIIALITKMYLTQHNKHTGFGFSDAYLAYHIQQIQQICDEVGVLTSSQELAGTKLQSTGLEKQALQAVSLNGGQGQNSTGTGI